MSTVLGMDQFARRVFVGVFEILRNSQKSNLQNLKVSAKFVCNIHNQKPLSPRVFLFHYLIGIYYQTTTHRASMQNFQRSDKIVNTFF
jgi:hypothetical protein